MADESVKVTGRKITTTDSSISDDTGIAIKDDNSLLNYSTCGKLLEYVEDSVKNSISNASTKLTSMDNTIALFSNSENGIGISTTKLSEIKDKIINNSTTAISKISSTTNLATDKLVSEVNTKVNTNADDIDIINDTINKETTGILARLTALETATSNQTMVNLIYPVGSIYISVNSTSPTKIFPNTTWEQLQNRFLVGAGGTYKVNATGGEATHTLTTDEMPSHRHPVGYSNTAGNYLPQGKTTFTAFRIGSDVYTPSINGGIVDVNLAGYADGTLIGYTGEGKAHNNLPPYLAVYMWKRTK